MFEFVLNFQGNLFNFFLWHFIKVNFDTFQLIQLQFTEEIGDDLANLDCSIHPVSKKRMIGKNHNNSHAVCPMKSIDHVYTIGNVHFHSSTVSKPRTIAQKQCFFVRRVPFGYILSGTGAALMYLVQDLDSGLV